MKFPWKVTAEEEFQKNTALIPKEFEILKQWYKSQNHLPAIDDEMLLHFYYACFYNIEQTKSVVDCYYTYRNTMPDFFSNWDTNDKELQAVVDNVIIAAPLPFCTSEGYRAFICKLNNPDINKFNYVISVKWLLISCTNAIWERGLQKGYIIVYDCTGFTMSHLLKCSLSAIKNYINYGTNASPIRVVKIVFINTSPVVKKLIALVKPFLSKEVINMLNFYTSAESFLKDLDKNNVPQDYGGEAPSLQTLHENNIKEVQSKREYLLEEIKARCDEKKRAGKSKQENRGIVEDSFQKLEID